MVQYDRYSQTWWLLQIAGDTVVRTFMCVYIYYICVYVYMCVHARHPHPRPHIYK